METGLRKCFTPLIVLPMLSGMAIGDDLRLPADAAARLDPATASCKLLTCNATDPGSLPFSAFTRTANWGLELFDSSWDSAYQDRRSKLAIEASLANFRAGVHERRSG